MHQPSQYRRWNSYPQITLTACLVLSAALAISGCSGSTPSTPVESNTSNADTTEPAAVNEPKAADDHATDASPDTELASKPNPSEPPDAASPSAVETKPPPETKPAPNEDTETTENASAPPSTTDDAEAKREQLEREIAAFRVPPDWVANVATKWDVATKPWKDGRVEIRRLLGLNDEAARREAIKLTWDYLQKKDIGDEHEYGMYMFLGKEPTWAIIAYRDYTNRTDLNYPPYFGLNALASIYAERGLFAEAEKELLRGLEMSPPKAEWKEMRKAEMHDALGDLYAAWGKADKAKRHYQESIRLFPLARPPYGRHLLPRRAKKVQSKLDLMTGASLDRANLMDGTYRDTALGYSGDIKLTVTIANGKIADIGVQHQEKIDQNACKLVPQRIIEKQSLTVDGITGATVTQDAIVGGVLRTLKQAGLK